ncbi:hypothetical protein ACFX15_035834 [Malus domestica]
MQSAQSTQQKESELRNSRSCHICLKKQAEKNAACTVNSAERVRDEELEKMSHLPEDSELVLTLKFLGRLTRHCGLHVPIHHP